MTPDISPNAFEAEYSLVIQGWPVKEIPGDNGGISIRFTHGTVLAKSSTSFTCTGPEGAKQAIQKALEFLLSNVEGIQIVAEKNAESVSPTLKVQVE